MLNTLLLVIGKCSYLWLHFTHSKSVTSMYDFYLNAAVRFDCVRFAHHSKPLIHKYH